MIRRLELEETNKKRAETRVIRLLGEIEEREKRTGDEEKKGKEFEEMNSKLKADIRKLVEKNTTLQVLCCFLIISQNFYFIILETHEREW